MEIKENTYSLVRLAEKLRMSKDTVMKYLKKNHFPNATKFLATKGGWQNLYSDVERFLQKNKEIRKLIRDFEIFEKSNETFYTADQFYSRQ